MPQPNKQSILTLIPPLRHQKIPRNLNEIVQLCSARCLRDENLGKQLDEITANESGCLEDLKCLFDDHLSKADNLYEMTREYEYGSKLNTVVRQLGIVENFEWLIDKILHSKEAMVNLVANSYRHQNGFDKFVLMESPNGWKLRLHIWWSDSFISFQESIHDHSWMFASNVLAGRIYSDIFQEVEPEADQAERFKEHQYTSVSRSRENHSNQFQINYVKDTWLRTTESSVMINAGQSYVFPQTMLHRILQPTFDEIHQNPNCGAVTLVLTAPRSRYTSRLINTCNTDYEEEQTVIKMTEFEIRRKLQYVCQYLKDRSDIPLKSPM
ncbi:unnamed protein product [Adineta ricciae]|uniref:Uncharacterized protein n=1 Tax=Adineta ricciae TaxID=249248 RepID=A0A815WV18_ADIRI|nr:unnamed protein product [Adineta ricciae]CAF1550082.1 unnamed protein product [Adineta ricciae]